MAPTSLITTRFDATSTAADVVHGANLSGRHALVTGASSGIGAETALALAAAGAAVTLAVRNVDAGLAVADRIAAATGRSRPQVRALDLADPTSVASLVSQWDAPLDILVNNAGLVTAGLERTRQGWELQFATNHLGHFALALGLQPHLAAAAHAHEGSRIVTLSSTAHMRAPVDFDDIHFHRRAYDPQIAYAQSKTANSLFAVEATKRWRADGIVANAVNPGGVATGLQRTSPSLSASPSTPPKPPGSSPTRPSAKERRRRSSRPSPPSSRAWAAATSMTAVRPTPCPTRPRSPNTPTA